jgi:hypothetical protein
VLCIVCLKTSREKWHNVIYEHNICHQKLPNEEKKTHFFNFKLFLVQKEILLRKKISQIPPIITISTQWEFTHETHKRWNFVTYACDHSFVMRNGLYCKISKLFMIKRLITENQMKFVIINVCLWFKVYSFT